MAAETVLHNGHHFYRNRAAAEFDGVAAFFQHHPQQLCGPAKSSLGTLHACLLLPSRFRRMVPPTRHWRQSQ